ncbi:MAG: DUF1153 domain-containing protein [Minisyncoccia bacterium]
MRTSVNPLHLVGPKKEVITPADIPPASTKRWTPYRKAVVVVAIRGGLISMPEAQQRFDLPSDELLGWANLYTAHGLPGLRSTYTQLYRAK